MSNLSPKPDAMQVLKNVYDVSSNSLNVNSTEAILNQVGTLYLNYDSGSGGTNVTTSAYTQLSSSLPAAVKAIDVFDSSGQALILALGGSGSEVNQLYVSPGGNGYIPFQASAAQRLSIKAKTATANVGYIVINLFG